MVRGTSGVRRRPRPRRACPGRVLSLHEELSRDAATLGRSVEELLDTGWGGLAADSYAKGWADWLEGAGTVLAGLDELGSLLGVNRATYQENEDTTSAWLRAASDRVRSRLS